MQQVNFKHCWIDSASARYEQEYMISFIISQKSVMPDRILRRYLLSPVSKAAAPAGYYYLPHLYQLTVRESNCVLMDCQHLSGIFFMFFSQKHSRGPAAAAPAHARSRLMTCSQRG